MIVCLTFKFLSNLLIENHFATLFSNSSNSQFLIINVSCVHAIDSQLAHQSTITYDFHLFNRYVRKLTHETRCIEVDENINYAEVLVTCRQIFCQRSALDLSFRKFTNSFYSSLTETRSQNHHIILFFRLRETSTSSFFLLLLLHACINNHKVFQSSF